MAPGTSTRARIALLFGATVLAFLLSALVVFLASLAAQESAVPPD